MKIFREKLTLLAIEVVCQTFNPNGYDNSLSQQNESQQFGLKFRARHSAAVQIKQWNMKILEHESTGT